MSNLTKTATGAFKPEKSAKTKNSNQGFWKETMSTMNNSELIEFFRSKKEQQRQILDFSYGMALGNVIQIIKKELNNRGLDWLSLSRDLA